MLPGTNRASDRFVRASFYIHAIPQTADAAIAVPGVLSVMRNVSVPFGITTPDKPHISSTRWRSVANQKDKVYYFESTYSQPLLARFEEDGFQPPSQGQETLADQRRSLCGRCRKGFERQSFFHVPVPDAGSLR